VRALITGEPDPTGLLFPEALDDEALLETEGFADDMLDELALDEDTLAPATLEHPIATPDPPCDPRNRVKP